MAASPFRMGIGAWVVSHTVSSWLISSQRATMPLFSMGAEAPRSYSNRRRTTRWAWERASS
jgi:hypothetical protein